MWPRCLVSPGDRIARRAAREREAGNLLIPVLVLQRKISLSRTALRQNLQKMVLLSGFEPPTY